MYLFIYKHHLDVYQPHFERKIIAWRERHQRRIQRRRGKVQPFKKVMSTARMYGRWVAYFNIFDDEVIENDGKPSGALPQTTISQIDR